MIGAHHDDSESFFWIPQNRRKAEEVQMRYSSAIWLIAFRKDSRIYSALLLLKDWHHIARSQCARRLLLEMDQLRSCSP